MNWQKLKETFLPQLERAHQQLGRIREFGRIIDLSPIVADGKWDLDTLEDQLGRFSQKLQRNQFVITVVGTEGSGKSSFVNALVGTLLLPQGQDVRTTLAAVEIRKALPGQPNSAEVTFKTKEEFKEILAGLKAEQTIKPDNIRVNEELEEIKLCRSAIDAHLGQGVRNFHNETLGALAQDIREYIVDKGTSRAVKKITVHIREFAFNANEKEIILEDLPGYNSPAKSHKEQTDLKLKDADLILFVFPVDKRVDLDITHVEILEISDTVSKAITTREKLFVFLNKADGINPLTRENIENKKRKSQQDWDRYVPGIPSERFTMGSAEAHQVKIGLKADELGAAANLARADLSSGIEELINKVNFYLENERPRLLKEALDTLVIKATDFISQVKAYLAEQHGIGSDHTGSIKDAYYYGQVNNWWMEERKELMEKFHDWYYTDVLQKDTVDDVQYDVHPSLAAIKQAHMETVSNSLGKFHIPDEKVDRQIKAATRTGVPAYTEANIALRREHVAECLDVVENASKALSKGLDDVIQALFGQIHKDIGLENPEAVTRYLQQKYAGNDEKKISYEAAIRALIVRYARPTIRVFMEEPHGLNDRQSKIQAHWKDIEILNLFSENLKPNPFDRLNVLKAAKVAGNVASGNISLDDFLTTIEVAAEVIESTAKIAVSSPIQIGKQAGSKEEVIQELKWDIDSISDLLREPIFEASGVLQYCLQEVERAKEFVEKEIQGHDLQNRIYLEFDKNNIPALRHLYEEFETKYRSSAEIAKLYADIWG